MTVSLTHLALHVRDLDACINFYQSYAGMQLIHDRISGGKRIVWLAEPAESISFILVLIPGGPRREQSSKDFSHLGFALETHDAIDTIADRARTVGILEWEPREEPYPVGYYCGIRDPNGNFVEFSYAQPFGPGASSEI